MLDDDPAPNPSGPPGDAALPDRTSGVERLRRYVYWSLVATSLGIAFLFAVTGPVPFARADPVGVSLALGFLVYAVAVVKLTGHHVPFAAGHRPLTARGWWGWTIAGTAAACGVAAYWATTDDPSLFAVMPVMLVGPILASVPARRRRVGIAVALVVATVAGVTVGTFNDAAAPDALAIGSVLMTAFVLVATLTSIWMWRIVVELDVARRTAAGLAVANERLRFAADLHDIQGHHLQVIALKSELASRLVHADPSAAAREIDQTHELALDALRDTRAVVQGYRRTSLATEISNATTVLSSAGIDARFQVAPGIDTDRLPPSSRHLLGLVVREAITNVLRHSSAERADVQLGGSDPLRLTITNDGANDGAPAEPRHGGLHDLAARLDAAGGVLTFARRGDRFEVVAELPTGASPSDRESTSVQDVS